MVVVITSLAVSYFFGLKIPTSGSNRSLDVSWHYKVVMDNYPLSTNDDLLPLVHFIHQVLDES